MEQMKVLQIGLGFNPGGMESFIMTYYRELQECGVQFDFIAMFPHIAYEEEIQALGGKIYHTSDARKHPVAFYREMRNREQKPQWRPALPVFFVLRETKN